VLVLFRQAEGATDLFALGGGESLGQPLGPVLLSPALVAREADLVQAGR
jgi:hypothetical protein